MVESLVIGGLDMFGKPHRSTNENGWSDGRDRLKKAIGSQWSIVNFMHDR